MQQSLVRQQPCCCSAHSFRPHSSAPGPRLAARLATRAAVSAGEASPTKSQEEVEREARQAVTRRIKQLGAQRKVKEAIKELASLAQLGIEPDTQAATALVAAAVQSRNMSLAHDLFQELFGGFLSPDEVTFAVLLRGHGAADPPAWQQMDAVLNKMQGGHGITPSAVSYNALLEVCLRTNDMSRGCDVLDRMAAEGVEPDDFTAELCAKKRVLRAHFRKTFDF